MHKIVWITNTPLKAVKQRLGVPDFGSGTWLDNLLLKLAESKEFQFYVFSPYPVDDFNFENGNIIYYSINNSLSINNKEESEFLKKVALFINEISPDLVHIHGTEKISGLLTKYHGPFKFPVIISLQGLTGPIFKILKYNIFHTIKIILSSKSGFINKLKFVYIYLNGTYSLYKSGLREKQIIKSNAYFFGRTVFDKNHIYKLNPTADYFDEPRILRSCFYDERWTIENIEKFSIVLLNIRTTAKKAETALYAASLLKNKYPELKIRIGGIDAKNYYGEYLLHLARFLGIDENLELLGYLTENETIHWLKKSNVFCLTSIIENSPNTLAEAQILGMPCVAHLVGGVSSYINNDCSLTFKNNSITELAEGIDRIFSSEEYASTLGVKAFEVASVRHNIEQAISKIQSVYLKLLT